MPSLFTRIILGEIPCHKIMEDERFLAFLDVKPLSPGHTLVIPKQEIDYIFDLEDDAIADLIKFAKRVALGIRKAVPCRKVGLMVAGLEVPHAHIHLVPIEAVTDLNFAKAQAVPYESLQAIAERIRAALGQTCQESHRS